MSLVAPGVHQIWLGIVNAYLIEAPEGLVLVDAGVPGSERKVLGYLASLGKAPSDLKHIVVTHAHPDHFGGLAALKAATGAQTWAHALDAPQVEHGQMRPVHPSPGMAPKLFFGLTRRLMSPPPPAKIDRLIEGDDEALPFGGLRAIRTPGHCLGQIVLLWPSNGVLMAADVCMNLFGSLRLPMVNEDAALAKTSFQRVAALEFDVACFGHGSPIRSGAAACFREATP